MCEPGLMPRDKAQDCNGTLTEVTPCPLLPECPVDCLWEASYAGMQRYAEHRIFQQHKRLQLPSGLDYMERLFSELWHWLRKRAHYEAFGGHVCYGTEECSTSCGNGTHVRTRSLTFAAYGGKDCSTTGLDAQIDTAVSERLLDVRGLSSRERVEQVPARPAMPSPVRWIVNGVSGPISTPAAPHAAEEQKRRSL
eukprot:Skav234071  [mRNA]  locus=scaffold2565:56407:58801:+ [translate_table: standard]